MSHWNGIKYYVQVAILTLPSKWKNISGISPDWVNQWKNQQRNKSDLIESITIWRCRVAFNNAARIIQKNWREYYLLNKIKPYTHRFKLDNCPLTRRKLLSDMDKVRLEISASRQFKPALHAKLNRFIRMYLAEDYDRFMTKRKKLWSEVKMVLNQELIARSNSENWNPVTPINLTENQKKWCHRAHCYSGARIIQRAWAQHWKKLQAEAEEYESDYSTESNLEAAKEAAEFYDFELYEHEFREMREEELKDLERLQEKMDRYVDDMCNPYNN